MEVLQHKSLYNTPLFKGQLVVHTNNSQNAVFCVLGETERTVKLLLICWKRDGAPWNYTDLNHWVTNVSTMPTALWLPDIDLSCIEQGLKTAYKEGTLPKTTLTQIKYILDNNLLEINKELLYGITKYSVNYS